MARKRRQTQLTFEPVAGSSSPGEKFSPAKVRYSNTAGTSSPSRASPSKQRAVRTPSRAKKTQSKLHDSIGKDQAASSSAKTTARFMPKARIAADSSDDEAFDADGPDIEWVENPLKSSQSVSTRLRRTVIDDEDEDDDDEPIVAPSSTRKRARSAVIRLDSAGDDDDDDDDAPLVPTSSNRRSRPAFIKLGDSPYSDVSPAKRQRTSVNTPGRLKRPTASTSSPTKPKPHKGHRSEKQKKMELLRRRRAGEKIDKLTSSEDDLDEEKRGLYDTDSEEEFNVLKEFDDEDEEVIKAPVQTPRKKSREKPKKQSSEDDSNDDNDLDGFVTDDEDAPLGAPANLDIPLEFTYQAIRPLKDQFPYAIEWLIHRRINPTFERNDPVYSNAWHKLDDEVRALASSKFASSAWKAEFYRALKARPKLDAYEMDSGEKDNPLNNSCEACGRRNHPATFKLVFYGHPYYKNTLDDVESESEDSEDDENDGGSHASVDTQGMTLPPTTKEWHVGSVCYDNAETASSLIHWKHALRQWVDERLEDDGWMKPEKLYEREHMKARKRRDAANEIADAWRESGITASLYRDFKATLEDARNKSTTRRIKGRFGR
ncbi:hypothetical protein GGR53DRAFT_498911 [Hypoxylon sp. FL1150]|nr:hypothetical protein GGR53DRAFT_498911 [Hypoxylon sp. FL1150]